MGMLKTHLMEMEEYAWELMLSAELTQTDLEDFDAARKLFLLKYPNNGHIWDAALQEYYAYGTDSGC